MTKNTDDYFISPERAAIALGGLSVGTVKNMVSTGILRGKKSKGGWWSISFNSIKEWRSQQSRKNGCKITPSHMNEAYVGTRQAAKMLGLAMGTVQSMVDRGELVAWRTPGGHRKICVKSINSIIESRRLNKKTKADTPNPNIKESIEMQKKNNADKYFAPDFCGNAVLPDNKLKEIKLADYAGSSLLLVFYTYDFSEDSECVLMNIQQHLEVLSANGIKVIAISADNLLSHQVWKARMLERNPENEIGFPLISDLRLEIAKKYGMLSETGVAYNGLVLINQEGVICYRQIDNNYTGYCIPTMLDVVSKENLL
jgi:excisionase family DNA binding protein